MKGLVWPWQLEPLEVSIRQNQRERDNDKPLRVHSFGFDVVSVGS